MNDTIVSIRLPTTLIQELKDLAKKNHYMDFSEQLRDIIRQKHTKYLPEKTQSKIKEMKEKTRADEKKQLIADLQSIIKELKRGL